MSAICALGNDLKETWEGVLQSRSGIGPITHFDTTGFTARICGHCRDFEASKWFSGRDARRLDRFSQFAVVGSDMVLEDAGLDLEQMDRSQIGCILGSGIGGLAEVESQYRTLIERGADRVSPFLVPKMMANAAAGQISIRHKLLGPNSAVVTACASAAHSIGDALNVIRRGLAVVMITGGSEAATTPLGMAGFCSLKALSTRNDDPQGASRPFDKDRDGFVMAEGAGLLVLEELEHAKARGARIYAELIGFGMTGDGSHITAPDPEGTGPAKCMADAVKDAELNLEQIDYLNAHGTSTQLNDKTETLAIKKAFGDHARSLAISSTKSQIGHTLGASGGLELVVTCMGIINQVAPPTINYTTPDPACDLDYVPNEPREMKIDYAISNSFGFGGHNASLVVKRFS